MLMYINYPSPQGWDCNRPQKTTRHLQQS